MTPTNPFAPPQLVPPEAAATPQPGLPARSWAASIAIWSLICIVSAAPSFAWGWGTIAGQQILAMLVGIGIFVAIYTCGDQFTRQSAWRRYAPVALTLKIGYASRILISLIIPLGACIDLICGLFSVGLVRSVAPALLHTTAEAGDNFGENVDFLGALLITLVQGTILNLVLFAYMLLVLSIVVMSKSWWQRHD